MDGAALAREVAARLGRDPFALRGERVIEGDVTRDTAWTARLYLRDRAGVLLGTRTLSSASPACAPLMGAVTLAIALMIDPDARSRLNSESAPPPPPPPPAPAPPPRPPLPPTRPSRRVAPLEATFGVAGAVGILPGPAAGVSLRVGGAIHGRFGWQVAATYLPELRTSPPDDGFAFGWTALSAGGCVDVVRVARGSVVGCVSLVLAGMHAVVYRPAPEVPGDRVWGAASASARATLSLAGPWVLTAEASLLIPFSPFQYAVAGRSTLAFEQSPVAGVGVISTGVSFR